MDPVNHWQPVTAEYQDELPLFQQDRLSLRRRAGRAGAGAAPRELPAGITCVSWFYLLAAGFYFVFGSVLLSDPSSNFASQLISYFRVVIPLPAGLADGVPLDNVLAEAFFLLAMLSATTGVLWLVRFRPVRWITLCYAGGEALWCAYYFLNNGGTHAGLLTAPQCQIWLAVSCIDALIFCYVAFYSGVGRIFDDSK